MLQASALGREAAAAHRYARKSDKERGCTEAGIWSGVSVLVNATRQEAKKIAACHDGGGPLATDSPSWRGATPRCAFGAC